MSELFSFKLPDAFLANYRGKSPVWGFTDAGGNSVGELTFVRTYSRKKEDGSKETWDEVCERVINGMYSIQKDHCKSNRLPWHDRKAQASAQEAYDRLFNLKWTPPGRGLWMMGTEFVMKNRNAAALQNCFAAETEYITSDGIKTLGETQGTTQKVLSKNGKWVDAEIRSFGEQELMRIVVSRNGLEKEIYATADHRWFAKDRRQIGRAGNSFREFSTKELNPNHRLQEVYGQGIKDITISPIGIAHGFVYGDGRASIGNRNSNSVTLFGEKDKALAPYFEGHPSRKDRDGIEFSSLPNGFKRLPVEENKSYVTGFLSGYFAADGSVDVNGLPRIVSYDKESINAYRSFAASVGIGTGIVREEARVSNLTGREHTAYVMTLEPETLTEEFFIIEDHRNRFANRSVQKRGYWNIVSVEYTNRKEEVFCAVVPDLNAFTLAENILTGNCGFVSTADIDKRNPGEVFYWVMDALMLGVGVGWDTLGADKGIAINRPLDDKIEFVVEDSREGWAASTAALVNSYLRPNSPRRVFDYSLVRPYGEPINGFGGTASGPEPLMKMHNKIAEILESRVGRTLDSETIADIMNLIGTCVVAGNVRRSAELALGRPDDYAFLNLKNPAVFPERNSFDKENPGWGWMSNNSLAVEVGTDYSPFVENIAINGEPGLVWLDTTRRYSRLVDSPDNKDHRAMGYNPCVTGDTLVMTADGPRRIDSLRDTPYNAIVDGDKHFAPYGSFISGEKQVYRLMTEEGYELKVTDNHQIMTASGEWVEAGDLLVGDQIKIHNHREFSQWGNLNNYGEGYLMGLFVGDGNFAVPTSAGTPRGLVKIWEGDKSVQAIAEKYGSELEHRSDWSGFRPVSDRPYSQMSIGDLPVKYGIDSTANKHDLRVIEEQSSEFYRGFLSGVFDADGHVEGYDNDKGFSVRLSQSDYGMLQSVQRMLLRLGITSKIHNLYPAGERVMPDGKGGSRPYQCKDSFRLVISADSAKRFCEIIGFNNAEKRGKCDQHWNGRKRTYHKPFLATVKSFEPLGVETVWDTTVEQVHAFDANGLYVHNCAEQSLESFECCTLVETHINRAESKEDFLRTQKFAYLYGKTVTLLPTHWDRTNAVMQRNRRIGASVTGMAGFVENQTLPVLRDWLDSGYSRIDELDRSYSEWLGVRESIKRTSVKPSGSVSLLSGATPGVHWPSGGEYYLRAIRFSETDPFVIEAMIAGYTVEPDQVSKGTVVIYFPIHAECKRSEKDVTIFEKIHLAAEAQKYWADNSVSVTVTFDRETEGQYVGTVLSMYEGQLKTVSFLPMGNDIYPQMPYTEITKEEYEGYVGKLKKIDTSVLYNNGEDAIGDRYCSTSTCEVKAEVAQA